MRYLASTGKNISEAKLKAFRRLSLWWIANEANVAPFKDNIKLVSGDYMELSFTYKHLAMLHHYLGFSVDKLATSLENASFRGDDGIINQGNLSLLKVVALLENGETITSSYTIRGKKQEFLSVSFLDKLKAVNFEHLLPKPKAEATSESDVEISENDKVLAKGLKTEASTETSQKAKLTFSMVQMKQLLAAYNLTSDTSADTLLSALLAGAKALYGDDSETENNQQENEVMVENGVETSSQVQAN